MADEEISNGIGLDGDDQAAEDYHDFDRENDSKISELFQMIQGLEQEKDELVTGNEEKEHKIKKLTVEIGEARSEEAKLKKRLVEMEAEIEQAQADEIAVEATTARVLELENEVARLQRELESAINNGDEATSEVAELKKLLAEKESGLEMIQRENELVKQGVDGEIEEIMKAKSLIESKVSELKKRIEVMEAIESEARTEKRKFEEETQMRIDEKEKEISGMKKHIGELEAVVAKNEFELEKEKKAKKDIEVSLGNSEEKVKEMEMEMKLLQLQKEAEQAEKVISGMKKKTVEAVNGISSQWALEDDMEAVKGQNLQWPIAATGTTIILAGAAVCYFYYAKRR